MGVKRRKRQETIETEEDLAEKRKTLRAKLLKIKLAGTGLPRNFDESTPAERRQDIQTFRKTTQGAEVPKEGNIAQRRLRKEAGFINSGTKIKPTKADQKISPTLKRKLAQLKQEQKIAKEHNHSIVFRGHELGVFRAAALEGQQGKYAKYWLLNAKQTNGNGWGISTKNAKQNMKRFVGRPLVVTSAKWHGASVYGDKFEHPYIPTNDLKQIFAHQEQFRVGTIIDVGEKNGDYYATIEMLPKFANMNLPPFCSPAIFQLDAKEPEGQISKWEALHLAALDENPAYGARIALLKGTCVGTANSCKVQFKGAKQNKFDDEDKTRLLAISQDQIEHQDSPKRKVMTNRGVVTINKTGRIRPPKPKRKDFKEIMSAKVVGRKGESKVDTIKRKASELLDGSIIMKDGPEKKKFKELTGQIVCPKKLKERIAGLSPKDKLEQNRLDSMFFEQKGQTPEKLEERNRKFGHGTGQIRLPRKERERITKNLNKRFGKLKKNQKIANFREFKDFPEKTINSALTLTDTGGVDANKFRELPEKNNKTKFMVFDSPVRDDLKASTNDILRSFKNKRLKKRIASLGEQNMTFQDSKKIKIHKKKHPEVRKAKKTPEDILRSQGSSLDGSHTQSSFLTPKGDFVGGKDIHDIQIRNILDPSGAFGATVTDDFIKKNNLVRVQNFPINRAGEKRVSVGINNPINKNQLKSIIDLEKGGKDIDFAVGPLGNEITGRGSRDLVKTLREQRLIR